MIIVIVAFIVTNAGMGLTGPIECDGYKVFWGLVQLLKDIT